GEPSCPGLDTASFAQDWKNFSFEPPGVAPLVKFYGGTNPTDFTQSGRYADCATPNERLPPHLRTRRAARKCGPRACRPTTLIWASFLCSELQQGPHRHK